MRYFELSEFDSPDLPGSGELMNKDLLAMLDTARERAGIPFIITSGFRTVEHNKAVNGKPTSTHLHGLAVDIKCKYSRNRMKIIEALLYVGFTRIGIAKDFVHVDIKSSGNEVIWVY